MYTLLRAAAVGFAVISTASAVQLASFAPRIEISNQQCRAAYTTNIDGCTAKDFETSATCSAACIQGLVKIGDVVNRVCKDVDVGETSIIGVFQNGIGIQALCPGVSVTTISSTTSSTKAPAQTSAPVQPPAKTTTTSAAAPPPASTLTTSKTTSASQSEVAQSSSISSGGIVTDPDPTSIANSAPTSVAKPPASSSAAAGSTRAPNAQLSNADSGGGSPFDVQAVGATSQLRTADVMMVAFLSTTLLFVGCA